MPKITEKSAVWAAHFQSTRLCRTVMGGTAAMREAGKDYLPPKRGEPDDDYRNRLNGAVLENYFKQTAYFYLGQIFQKPVQYQAAVEGETEPFDRAWFDAFAEDVDQNGRNLNTFAKKLFKAGVVESVAFILVDHARPQGRRKNLETGREEYLNGVTGQYEPWTAAAEEGLGLRPYFILVKAEQVLDAWLDVENGRKVLKHFRYAETVEKPLDEAGLNRQVITRVVAWWPHRWKIWEANQDGGEPALIDEGDNKLGFIPLAWFVPEDDDLPNLTAMPILADLAEMNRSHWVAWSEEDARLMPFVRSPALLGKMLTPPVDEKGQPMSLNVGPGQLLAVDNPDASLQSVGVDPSSVQSSAQNLQAKQDSMRNYGLQSMMPNITATQSENSAVTVNAVLRGLVESLKDALENALRIVALYKEWPDGPAVVINKEFKRGFDIAYLNFLMSTVRAGIYRPEVLTSEHIAMMPTGDEWTSEKMLNPSFGQEEKQLPEEFFRPTLAGPRTKSESGPAGPSVDGGPKNQSALS